MCVCPRVCESVSEHTHPCMYAKRTTLDAVLHSFMIIVVGGGGSVLLARGSQLRLACSSWRRAWWCAPAAPPVGSGDRMASSGFAGHAGTSTSPRHLRILVATQPTSQSPAALAELTCIDFTCQVVLLVYLSAWCPHRPGEGVRSPAQGLQVVVSHLVVPGIKLGSSGRASTPNH